jgi:putative ABC transport system substrate-binding protein
MQFDQLRRREVITLIGGAAAWPLAARAQQGAMPVIGYLHSSSPELSVPFIGAFRKGLSEAGFVEGQNVTIEFRWAAGREDRLPELAADLVRRRVAVIVTPTSTPAALAAKGATTTIPIVFATGADPVALGLVKSLNQPGGNLTGIHFQTVEAAGKQAGLLRELAPQAKRFVALVNPNYAFTAAVVTAWEASATAIGLPIEILRAGTVAEIDAAFANLTQKVDGSALLISPGPFFTSRRTQLATLTARHAIPAIYGLREFAESGGLMSYGPSFSNVYEQSGIYTGRVLKGEKPADMPVLQPTKFELVINLQTAKALGIDIPPTLLARADEVIE